ncbi:MAG TPA: PA domain-containing protein, partial [Pyrinomonadaceae bacterium]|nr:PA domain-containing protein [Pyrinomonadaceae bacterium]
MTKIFRPLLLSLFFAVVMLGASSTAFATATIVILNNDAAGVGFNDTTAATPVGGNSGTTLGQQRLNAFQAAATKWGATIDSPITITIRAQWAAQACTATGAVLGSAGAIGIFRDFTGAPFAGTWYNESLTSKLFGADPNPAQPEITATFNINLGQPGCLTGTFFYLGLDGNHGTNIDLVTVLTHEFGHGLGFQTFTNAQTGAQNSGFPGVYDHFLMDNSNGKSWLQMTNAERAASSINTHKLVWTGPQVQTDVPTVLSLGVPVLTINSPAGIAGTYDPGGAAFGPIPPVGGVTGNLKLANDGTAPVEDGCEAFPAGFFTGQIALIDRGTCSFKTKTLNAQNAGATAVIIANNVAGTPANALGDDATIVTPITIPSISVTQADGNTIKAQLGGGVNATVFTDPNTRAGADQFGKALLYTPNPFVGGSSVSHWATTATPNLLMEPNINGDLTHEVTPPQDLTFSQLRDIGWVASAIPTAIAKTGGDNQNTALNASFTTPLQVTVSPAIAGITVTWTANNGGSGAGASFPSTSGRAAVSVTNASGVATAPPLTANGSSGLFSLNATAPGAGTTTFNLSVDPTPIFGPSCSTDTTQANFAAGTTNNTDVNTSPGNVVLLNPANADQTQTVASTSGTGLNTTQWLGQTFVPGVTGKLQRIDMALFCASCSGTDQPITVEIRTTTGSPALPTSTVLATTTLPGFNSGASSTFSVNFATPATLTAGTTYAYTMRLVTNRTGTYAAVFGNAPTDYANGNRVVSQDSGGTWVVPTSTGIARDLVFTTFMQTGNAASGNFTSSLKDSNPPFAGTSQWGTLSWNATVPAGTTLQFQAAASNSFGGPFNFVGPDNTAGTFFTNGASLSQFNGFRYLKYKAFFTTTDGTLTPTLADVTICFNNPSAVLNLSKTSDRNPAVVELNFNYNLVITNTGDTSATNVVLTDPLPALVTFTAATSSQGTCTYTSMNNTVVC